MRLSFQNFYKFVKRDNLIQDFVIYPQSVKLYVVHAYKLGGTFSNDEPMRVLKGSDIVINHLDADFVYKPLCEDLCDII